MLDDVLQWDDSVLIYLNNLSVDGPSLFWVTVTSITNWIPLFLLFIGLFFYTNNKTDALKQVLWVIALAIFIAIITYLVKEGIQRPRPNNDEALNGLIKVFKSPTDFSFFSGHASSSFSITLLVCLLLKTKLRWVWVFFIWPLLFSYSRIKVGVHYPTDILVGAFVGLTSGYLFYKVYKRLFFKAPYSA